MTHLIPTPIIDNSTTLYKPFKESITTINVNSPNPTVMRTEHTISIGSQILNITDMEHFANTILTICKNIKETK